MATIKALINKDTLAQIISRKKVSLAFLSEKSKQKEERLSKWIDVATDDLPTINQAKTIAKILHIPFAGLYMNANDVPYKSIPRTCNYRTLYGHEIIDDSALNIAIGDLLLERDFLLSTNDELEIVTKDFDISIAHPDECKIWASELRRILNVNLKDQYKMKSSRQFYLYLREKVEAHGAFVHCFTDVPVSLCRGFAIYSKQLPLIGINEEDRPPAKSFSIIHELVHIIKRESSVCNDMAESTGIQTEEVFCNAVAGEFLVPEDALLVLMENRKINKPYAKENIEDLANAFSVSREVITRRLLNVGMIGENEYSSYMSDFAHDIEIEKENQREARRQGISTGVPRNMAREAFDRTISSICKVLLKGYSEEVFSKQDLSRHIGIDQKHIGKFLTEVSKWNK